MPRLFVALDLPDLQRRVLQSLTHGLPGETRWTPVAQLHLTLRFIGEVDDHSFGVIKNGLAGLPFPPFWLKIAGLGCFPSRHQARILWAGVGKSPELAQVQELIEGRLVQLGLAPEERSFHPHLTIARLPPGLSPAILAAYLASNGQVATPPFLVEGFNLYSSRLTRAGAVYQIEATWRAS